MSAVQTTGAVISDTLPGDAKPGPQPLRREDVSGNSVVDRPSEHRGDEANMGVRVTSNEAPMPQAAPTDASKRTQPRIDDFVPTFSGQVFCYLCKADITGSAQIRCATCPSTVKPVDLCPQCMVLDTQAGEHKRSHEYRVMDNLAIPLSEEFPDWTAEEELRLLEGIQQFGFGNWKQVSLHIGTKSAAKVQAFYVDKHLAGREPGRLSPSHPYFTETTVAVGAASDRAAPPPNEDTAAHDMSAPQPSPSPTNGTAANETPAADASEGPTAEQVVTGYLPLRGDFDVEHDNSAELILADMEFNEDDDEAEEQLKLKILEIYNGKLQERLVRKRFVLQRGLLDFKKQQALERRRTKEEREVYSQLRPFARFHSPEEHEQLVQGIVLEQELRRRIEKLQAHRRNGLRSLQEVQEYEKAEKQRATDNAMKRQRQTAAFWYDSKSPAGSSRDRGSRYRQRGQKRGRSGLARSATVPASSDSAKSPRTATTPRPQSKHVSLEGAPDVDKLSMLERTLCETLHLLPSQYLAIKSRLIEESAKQGFISRTAANSVVRCDKPDVVPLVYDLCVQCGWVVHDPDQPAPSHNPPVGTAAYLLAPSEVGTAMS